MRKISLFTIILLSTISVPCIRQNLSLEISKDTIRLDELVEITVKIDFDADSINLPDFRNFNISSGPRTVNQMKSKNGKTTYDKSWIYILRPITTGELSVDCATAYIDGAEVSCPARTILVVNSDVSSTDVELKRLRFDTSKPEGTKRITIHGNIGFIEVFEDGKWEYVK